MRPACDPRLRPPMGPGSSGGPGGLGGPGSSGGLGSPGSSGGPAGLGGLGGPGSPGGPSDAAHYDRNKRHLLPFWEIEAVPNSPHKQLK